VRTVSAQDAMNVLEKSSGSFCHYIRYFNEIILVVIITK